MRIIDPYWYATGGGPTYLLDSVTGALTAYSLRLLRAAYSGSAIRVRRDSDSAEQDIGFSSGDFDTSSLTTFVGAGSGYVTKFYDQSGNSNDWVQATAANQPRIVNSGSVETVNSFAALTTPGFVEGFDNDPLSSDWDGENMTLVAVCQETSGTSDYVFRGGNYPRIFGGAGRKWGYHNGTLQQAAAAGDGNQNILFINAQSTGLDFWVNGSSVVSAATAGSGTTTRMKWGSETEAGAGGTLQEFIVWNGTDVSGDRSTIESNINDYYSIY